MPGHAVMTIAMCGAVTAIKRGLRVTISGHRHAMVHGVRVDHGGHDL
jgi:hypothetical protein